MLNYVVFGWDSVNNVYVICVKWVFFLNKDINIDVSC